MEGFQSQSRTGELGLGGGVAEDPIRIFISYRRSETRGYAGWVSECLEAEFGSSNVFRDVEKIRAGDWRKAIDKGIRVSDVVLCLMGEHWLAVLDERLTDQSEDVLRGEVGLALRLKADKKRVIPVLLDGAPMPTPEILPEDLSRLPAQNAHSLNYESWGPGLEVLFAKIREVSFRRPRLLKGSEIAARWEKGLDVPSFVGVNGGFAPRGKGTRLAELVRSEGWELADFQVQFGGVCPSHPNWGEVDDFLTAVELKPYATLTQEH